MLSGNAAELLVFATAHYSIQLIFSAGSIALVYVDNMLHNCQQDVVASHEDIFAIPVSFMDIKNYDIS